MSLKYFDEATLDDDGMDVPPATAKNTNAIGGRIEDVPSGGGQIQDSRPSEGGKNFYFGCVS